MTQENISGASPSLSRLVQELNRLPGIGPKSAQRLAYHLIRIPREDAQQLAQAILAIKEKIIFCNSCRRLLPQHYEPCFHKNQLL